MSRKNGADARAKKAAQLFVACKGNPDPTGRLSIPNVMRLRGYSHDEAINHTLQIMQVRREVEKLKGNASTSAPAVLSAANAKIWRFFSVERVCFHQRWATWRIEELYISSLLATEETTIWATLLDGRRRTRPIYRSVEMRP